MQITIAILENLISDYTSRLNLIDDDSFSKKPYADKWSKKEILGHLIDSAQTNIRRIVIAQYEDNPTILYDQEQWVVISDYQHYNNADLIELWALLNKHFCHILKNVPSGMEKRICTTQTEHTLEWLAEDYVTHLKHHMHVILELDPVAYP